MKNSSSCTLRSNDAYRLRQRIHNRDHSNRKPGRDRGSRLQGRCYEGSSGDGKLVLSTYGLSEDISKKRFTHRLRTSSAVRSLLRQAAQTTVIQS